MRTSEDAPVDSMGCEKAGSSLPPRVQSSYICNKYVINIKNKE